MTKKYVMIGIVFILSIGTLIFVPMSEIVKGMVATPGVAALLGALYQIFRDAAAFEAKKELQADQQVFALGASSHMATIAFDKHVEFCEAYMSKVHETIELFFREGPTSKAMEKAAEILVLRQRFAAWINKEISVDLEPFEAALRAIGSKTHLVSMLMGDGGDIRKQALDESYDVFSNVLGMPTITGSDYEERENVAAENVKERIRAILGINELLEVRKFIIQRSAKFARENT